MRAVVASGLVAGLLLFAVTARGEQQASAPSAPAPSPGLPPSAAPSADLSLFSRPLSPAGAHRSASAPAAAPVDQDGGEIDVVDAHWMALTMWGEARGDGEEGMRAVGHVIANRRLAGTHGAFVTDTVSEASQFSCWNPGDPNREAMLNVEALPRGSRAYRLWETARQLAAEILAGRSQDPTGGALFYHRVDVAPAWSRGVPPVRRIGDHLFFRETV